MFLFGGTFFPLENMPGWAQTTAVFLPLTHLVNLARSFATGELNASVLAGVIYLAGFCMATIPTALYLMRRRLIK
jgi:lipooligosaccharide transport system permease protein